MHQVQLSDQLYDQAQRRALEAGFKTVDEYIADVVSGDLVAEDFDHLFTPDRLAHIDGVIANVKAGGVTYTLEEVREHLANNRTDWLKKHA